MDLSIVIVSWKVKQLVDECLESVYKETQNINFEVLLVDNDSGDGTVEMVKEKYPQVKLYDTGENLGFAKGNNLAIRDAKGRYVLLLNPDTKVLDAGLEKCVKYLDEHREYDVLGAKLLYPNHSLQESCRRFPTFCSQALILLKLHNFFPNWGPIKRYYMKDFDYKTAIEVDQVMGAFILAKKKVFDHIGLLDEAFFAWFEEVDWCLRVKNNGYKIIFYPDAEIIHHKGQSFNQYWRRQWLFDQSLMKYFKKHHFPLGFIGIILLVPINLILDLLIRFLIKIGLPLKKKKNL